MATAAAMIITAKTAIQADDGQYHGRINRKRNVSGRAGPNWKLFVIESPSGPVTASLPQTGTSPRACCRTSATRTVSSRRSL